jgi:hypothetical protein
VSLFQVFSSERFAFSAPRIAKFLRFSALHAETRRAHPRKRIDAEIDERSGLRVPRVAFFHLNKCLPHGAKKHEQTGAPLCAFKQRVAAASAESTPSLCAVNQFCVTLGKA